MLKQIKFDCTSYEGESRDENKFPKIVDINMLIKHLMYILTGDKQTASYWHNYENAVRMLRSSGGRYVKKEYRYERGYINVSASDSHVKIEVGNGSVYVLELELEKKEK